jgi:hypothetical protein
MRYVVLTATLALLGASPAYGAVSEAEVGELASHAAQYGPVEAVESVSPAGGAVRPLATPISTTIVQIRGHFVYTAHVLQGSKAPEGTAIDLEVGAESTHMELRKKALKLKKLGGVKRYSHVARAKRVRARKANWGLSGYCWQSNPHCYSLVSWQMVGGERVKGYQCEVNTGLMNVVDWGNWGGVSNECWTAFPSKGWWLEVGTFSGAGWESGPVNCCQLNWFVAENQAPQKAYSETDYVGALPGNTWINYGTKYEGNGVWCVWVGANWSVRMGCYPGFPSYSTRLDAGAEYATEQEPWNAGSVVTNGEWMDGSHHMWNFDRPVQDTGTCGSRYWPNTYGDWSFRTC